MSKKFFNKSINKRSFILACLIALLVTSYSVFEIWTKYDELDEDEKIELAKEALNSAHYRFSKFETEFIYDSNEFFKFSKQSLESSLPYKNIVDEAEKDYSFWGVSLFKGSRLTAWSGFGAQKIGQDISSLTSAKVTVEQDNNVIYLNYIVPLTINQGDSNTTYFLVTRQKIQQENILPFGENSEVKPSQLFQSRSEYPVHFSFFDDPPDAPLFSTVLSTQSQDSVGTLYALSEDHTLYESTVQNQYFLIRAIFYALLIILSTFFLISVSRQLSTWNSLLLKLFAIILAWFFFSNLEYGIGWLKLFYALEQEGFIMAEQFLLYCIHALFIFLIAIISTKPLLNNRLSNNKEAYPIILIIFIFYGVLVSLLFYFFMSETQSLIYQLPVSVLDLEVFPNLQTLIFYIASGSFIFSGIIFSAALGSFLMRQSKYPLYLPFIFIVIGYCATIILTSFIGFYNQDSSWILITSSLLFLSLIVFLIFQQFRPNYFEDFSQFRMLLFISFVCVCISYISVYKGYSERLNLHMDKAAQSFSEVEASKAEDIAQELLTSLTQNLSYVSEEDLVQRPSFIKNIFSQQTQQLISGRWESFSISTQLIDNSGSIIGEYSTDLDTPAWTKAFNMLSLMVPFEEERIRIENLRPIIRERPLNEAVSNYSAFRRAWIPLYENGDESQRTGWILCSVYRERPQYEKPIRAVIASHSNDNWDVPINITEYIDGQASRKNILGLPLDLPDYLTLPDDLMEEIQENKRLSRVLKIGRQPVRELFVQNSDEQIVRSATRHPSFENHIFSILRFYFSFLTAGFLLLTGISVIRKELVFGQNNKFRDRLIDRFILAAILCLMVLISTTYYTVKTQNQKSVQYELLNKLENLAEAISLQDSESAELSDIPLLALTSTIDADAALYRGQILTTSTTTQIYNQHLLPRLLNWEVHEAIFELGNRQVTRVTSLGDQDIMIGYQPWLNENSEIAGVISIPTFLEAPKFNDQLLSTTSYLIIFYVIIFGLFIIGAALISTQITSPLEALQEGLKKISAGDLETTLPVKSNDEIGSLTTAYNIMVNRLKELQIELAKAEREAAWKEMAQQVAHEIKNPLTPMKLNLQHLERQLKASEDEFSKMKPNIEKIAKNMIGQIESLSKIASDFSNFAKPTKEEFKPVEINALIESAIELYEQDKDLSFEKILSENKLIIEGAKGELRRVLINLIKNAKEAMHGSGKIIISTSYTAKDKFISISVQDFGQGIPEESRDQIFVPNFSTKSSGTGLGLAISEKIVNEHGGGISFESEVSKGTIFNLKFPVPN
jgi:signal transduction histidine kinase